MADSKTPKTFISKPKLTRVSSCKNSSLRSETSNSTIKQTDNKKIESLPELKKTIDNSTSLIGTRRSWDSCKSFNFTPKNSSLQRTNLFQSQTPRALPSLLGDSKVSLFESAEIPKTSEPDLFESHRKDYLDRNSQVNSSVMKYMKRLIPQGRKARELRRLEAFAHLPPSKNLKKFFAKIGIKDSPKDSEALNSSIDYDIKENMSQGEFANWLQESSKSIARNIKNPTPVVDLIDEITAEIPYDDEYALFDEETIKRPRVPTRGKNDNIVKSLNDLCDNDMLSDVQRDYLLTVRRKSEAIVKVRAKNPKFPFNSKKEVKSLTDLNKDSIPKNLDLKLPCSLIIPEEMSPKNKKPTKISESEQPSTARGSILSTSSKESKQRATAAVFGEDIKVLVARINEEKKHQKSALQAIKKMSRLFEKKVERDLEANKISLL